MLSSQNLSIKVRKKIEKIIRKKGKLESKMKQAREMGDTIKVKKLGYKIKKLEEDMKKMIELKDGKLKKVEGEEEKKPVEQTQVDEKEVADTQPNPFDDVIPSENIPGGEQPVQQPVIPGQPMVPQKSIQPVPVMSQESIQPVPVMSEQQPIPSQEMVKPLQVQQPPATVEVNISLVGGIVIKLPMDGTHLQQFLQEAINAIDSQASMQIGNQLINGRNIVVVSY